ncbi:hypothetical protein EW145_g2624 [Phellinidium pouzarii]|uniref:Uncharacterized protein n=1 Tax=Phellinidium pouzarii TaxID=167371 RepID=A0A4S4LA45_9AGAM|nr:hypothetical protein EW145_g2624 [Phellinidium pouzarii]
MAHPNESYQSPVSDEENERIIQTHGSYCTGQPASDPAAIDFLDFYWTTLDLRVELARCLSKFRIIGLCTKMISAVQSVLEHIDLLRSLFGQNAKHLFPKEPALKEVYKERYIGDYGRVTRPYESEGNRKPFLLCQFQFELEKIDEALGSLDVAFQDYDEIYTDEKVKMAIAVIRKELQHDTEDISRRISGRGETLSMTHKHINSMLPRLNSRFQFLKQSLEEYISEGISSISSVQKAKAAHFLTLSTIATFFSGVTSTLLQMVYQGTNDWARFSLLVSLAFSVSSALSSLVAVSWYRSMILPPSHSWRKQLLWFSENWPSFAFVLSIYGFYSGLIAIYWNLSNAAFNATSFGIQIVVYAITSYFTITYIIVRIRTGLVKFKEAPAIVTEITYESFTSGIMDARDSAARRVSQGHTDLGPGSPSQHRPQTAVSSRISMDTSSASTMWLSQPSVFRYSDTPAESVRPGTGTLIAP